MIINTDASPLTAESPTRSHNWQLSARSAPKFECGRLRGNVTWDLHTHLIALERTPMRKAAAVDLLNKENLTYTVSQWV
jgi:hypothetical protein